MSSQSYQAAAIKAMAAVELACDAANRIPRQLRHVRVEEFMLSLRATREQQKAAEEADAQ